MSNYRIVKLITSNFKNLKAVEINPAGHVVTLAGSNGAGKSSVLDAMEEVIAGGKDKCECPIRRGAKTADTEIVLTGGLVARRHYTPSGSTLRVEIKDEPQKSPQAIMDKFKNVLSFDPLGFTLLKPKEQREILLKLLGLDFTSCDVEAKKLYDARTEKNREVERLQALLCSMAPRDNTVPPQVVSVAALMAELDAALAHNAGIQDLVAAVTTANANIKVISSEMDHANAQIRAWQKVLEDKKKEFEAAVGKALEVEALAKAAVAKDTQAIRDQMANAEKINAAIANNDARVKNNALLTTASNEWNDLNKQLLDLEAAKAKAIRDAKFPLPGLTFDDGGLFFNGIPFNEISKGQKIRVSVAICMAMNPTLRVIFVRDGSLLDEAGIKVIAEMAEANDYQVWIEDARSQDPSAVVIEDGEFIKAPGLKAPDGY